MKLKNKLYISFCIMVILPVLLSGLALGGLYCVQKESIERTYNVDDGAILVGVYSPIILFGKITDSIYKDMKTEVDTSPEQFTNKEYLDELSGELSSKMSCLVVRRNGIIIYNSTEAPDSEIVKILPDYSADEENVSDVGTYKGGEYQSLIKQLNFKDSEDNFYSVSIVTSLKQILPQVKTFIMQVIFVIIMVLIITSLGLTLWIYSSIVKPLNKLKLATDNIKEGNMDFEMPKVSNNEIGDVCRDFEEMRKRLKESAEEKVLMDKENKELISNISHDLKTPITAVKGYVEGIMDGVADTPEKIDRYVKTIYNKTNEMDHLINELTFYSKIDTNRIPYTFSKLNVEDYFSDCAEEVGLELETRGIELVYANYVEDNVQVIADGEQIRRVIHNIISNAIKYMDKPKGIIQIRIKDVGDFIQVEIEDNGKGIAAKDLPSIFDRFYRTDVSRNSSKGGSGIGLSIVKKILEDHGGKVWATSRLGIGTIMYFVLRKYQEVPMK